MTRIHPAQWLAPKFNGVPETEIKICRAAVDSMSKFDIYETVTNLIVERLEAGVVPWHMPWKTASTIPRNLVSKKPYRGF